MVANSKVTFPIIGLLLLCLAVSLGFNFYPLFQSPVIIGVAESKTIGHGTDDRGPSTWYTVSLTLATEDHKNDIPIGSTMAYIVDKEVFDQLQDWDVVKGSLNDGLKMDMLKLTHSTDFARGDPRFFRESDSQ